MVDILFLLAPGGLSWFRDASRPSRSVTLGVSMTQTLYYAPRWYVLSLRSTASPWEAAHHSTGRLLKSLDRQ